jgi:hypothetical protein
MSRIHYEIVVLTMTLLAVFGVPGLARFGYASIPPASQTGSYLTNTQTGEPQ